MESYSVTSVNNEGFIFFDKCSDLLENQLTVDLHLECKMGYPDKMGYS